ncbi:ATP-binding response regulator [Noviherbaspirillum suwonense]|uniref:histidine kinase n=1 Tax=Noviherbaspirillum suwonense TaxID=1224511 RepID=A0ABY1QM39_9BURK|nr:response regulator [Noviherbaspirillum suwonense]SMP73403.1 Signal transduction histidine kinase [Noviherbaspirillum suwonense]
MNAGTHESLVLNVDDNDGARYAKTRILTRAGLRVIEAASGGEALQAAQEHHPDLVLLDMKLPDIHGMEVCRMLKQDAATSSILVLQTSASYLSSADKIRALDGGADNYLFEPIEPEELVANVRALLRLGRVERQLRESDRQKDEFLATLAHELRNPLGPIRNAVELLRQLGGDSHEQQEQARHTIVRQTNHLVRLVDDLLDVSRINQGKITLRREPAELSAFIGAAQETVQPIMQARQHALSVSLPPQTVTLFGDSVRLAQIVGNLLHNAAKFTPVGGRIALDATLDANTLVLRISDNGIGVPATSAGRIFELFAQAQHVPDRVQDGLGIGLSLVKKLVELHGGSVSVSSAGEGLGSTFEVRLPVMQASAPAQSAQQAPAASGTSGGYRILVVDDSVDSASMLCALLEISGHTVLTSHTGKDAIAAATQFHPEIIFLDIGLPDMTGYEVAARMRRLPDMDSVKLVALTGYGQEKDKQDAKAAGFDHHLVKPINFDALTALTTRP